MADKLLKMLIGSLFSLAAALIITVSGIEITGVFEKIIASIDFGRNLLIGLAAYASWLLPDFFDWWDSSIFSLGVFCLGLGTGVMLSVKDSKIRTIVGMIFSGFAIMMMISFLGIIFLIHTLQKVRQKVRTDDEA